MENLLFLGVPILKHIRVHIHLKILHINKGMPVEEQQGHTYFGTTYSDNVQKPARPVNDLL